MSLKNKGIIASLWALLLPAVFLFLTLFLQLHLDQLRRAEIKHITKQAIRTGFFILQNEMVSISENRKKSLCMGEEPPSICSSNNPYDFILESDKSDALLKTHSETWQQIKIFIENHDPQKDIMFSDIQIYYPYFSNDPWSFCAVGIKVDISYSRSQWGRGVFFVKDSKVSVESHFPLD